MQDEISEYIKPPEVRTQLDRIFAYEEFSESERLKEFLEFVIQETLAGRGARIKSTTIAQEVFGRGEDFDPQQDSIVRVEAGRLRRLYLVS